MDLSRPIYYRGLNLNTAASAGAGDPISGMLIDQVLFAGAPGVGYTEKRSLTDGFDASDVYLGRRSIRVRATVFGLNRADLYDRKQALMSCIHPTAAYFDAVADHGYLPLQYDEPTLDVVNFPEDGNTGMAWKTLQVYARPLAQPDIIIDRDRVGGQMNRGLAMSFQWGWDVIDPRVYLADQQSYDLSGAGPFTAVPITNRGDYPSPVNVQLNVPAALGEAAATITVGTGVFVIHVADSTADQIYRFSARQKVLTVEENGVETMRMDLLDTGTDDPTPSILPGDSSFRMTCSVQFSAGSRLFYNEAFA